MIYKKNIKADREAPVEIDWIRFSTEIRLLPNLLTLLRLLLIVPIILLYPHSSGNTFKLMLVLLTVSYISDFADGYFARRFQLSTNVGKILDPVVDKIWTLAMILLLYFHRDLQAWIALVIISRDFIIIAMNIVLWRKMSLIMPSAEFGKAYMVLMGVMIITMTLNFPLSHLLAKGLTIMAVFTAFKYYQSFQRMVEKRRDTRVHSATVTVKDK